MFILLLFVLHLIIEFIFKPRLIYNQDEQILILFYGKKHRDYIILFKF